MKKIIFCLTIKMPSLPSKKKKINVYEVMSKDKKMKNQKKFLYAIKEETL